MIESQFPAFRNRIAAGLAGLGSECFGFDDALSRDHDWGPGFCLWLAPKDFGKIGASLQKAYEALPERFMGFRRAKSEWGGGRVGVTSIDCFYASFIGTPHAPENTIDWMGVSESNLAACTNGKVFNDPLGTFTAVRNRIKAHYPDDVRLKKIAAKCMSAAQSGQYNYPRCIRRSAYYPSRYALVAFCEDALALVFLLHRKYMPFYKWACKAAEALPMPGPEIAKAVNDMNRENDPAFHCDTIGKICAALIAAIRSQGLSDAESDCLLDHGPRIHARIQDSTLKRLDVWWGGKES